MNDVNPIRPDRGADDIDFARILNVVWRRKAVVLALTLAGLVAGIVYGLVTTPLYSGTATIRPGITAFGDEGAPVREWRLKDITRWYQRRLYAPGVNEALGRPESAYPPDIRAEFIARGTQSLQGGNVVTLSTLAVSPEEATAILDASVAAFNAYAERDTLSNGLTLTRSGLEIQIAGLENRLREIDAKQDLADIEIERARQELREIDIDQQRFDLRRQRLEAGTRFRDSGLSSLEGEIATMRDGLDQVYASLDEMKQAAGAAPVDSLAVPATAVDRMLLSELLRDDSDRIDKLLESLQVRGGYRQSLMMADTLRYQRELTGLDLEDLLLNRDLELTRKRFAAEMTIRELEVQRDQSLELEREGLRQEIRSRRTQLAMLSPLEKIGPTTSTQGPVRPRRLRAAALLTLFGLLGSLVAVFVLDYLIENRRRIFTREASRV